MKLLIERWIGLEGNMSVKAYPQKGMDLLEKALGEDRGLGVMDMYTHEIALSPSLDTKEVMYATPPGAIAFFYYLNNLLVIFCGVLDTVALVILLEYLVINKSSNPLFASVIGVGTTTQVLYMGTGGLFKPLLILVVCVGLALLLGLTFKYLIARQAKNV